MEVKTKESLDDNIVTIDLERTLGLALGATKGYEISKKDISDYNRMLSEIIAKSNLSEENISILFDENYNSTLNQYYEFDEKEGKFKLKEEYRSQFKEYLEKVKLDLISWLIIKNNIQDESEIKKLLGQTEEEFNKQKVLK